MPDVNLIRVNDEDSVKILRDMALLDKNNRIVVLGRKFGEGVDLKF